MDNLINTYKYYMFPVKLQVWPRDKIIFTSKKKTGSTMIPLLYGMTSLDSFFRRAMSSSVLFSLQSNKRVLKTNTGNLEIIL